MRDKNQEIRVRKDGSLDVVTINDGKPDPGMKPTQQQFANDCDINQIMARYERTGEFLNQTSKTGQYADFSGITDYQEMLDTVIYAQNAFSTLPAKVRAKFANDPGNLLNFLSNPDNRNEAIELGLIDPPTELAPKQNEQNDIKPAPPQPKPV